MVIIYAFRYIYLITIPQLFSNTEKRKYISTKMETNCIKTPKYYNSTQVVITGVWHVQLRQHSVSVVHANTINMSWS